MRRIAITTGDQDGIGPEITFKALKKLGRSKTVEFFVFSSIFPSNKKRFGDFYPDAVVDSLTSALRRPICPGGLVIINQGHPVQWVEEVAAACLRRDLAGMVTGPLAKSTIQSFGKKDVGHTEILERISGVSPIFQGYLGPRFNVVLATAHVPIKDVSCALSSKTIKGAIRASLQLRSCLRTSKKNMPIAFLGLNPHAGEGGLLGKEDLLIRKTIERMPSIEGPLVPDVAFQQQNWDKFSVFIANYHDQGLIPFKMIHGPRRGVQVSLGLPFTRTSVDHGTAKDIAGKNKADAGSMIDAIKWCLRLTKGQ